MQFDNPKRWLFVVLAMASILMANLSDANSLLINTSTAPIMDYDGKKANSFPIYDGTLYKNKPDISQYGIEPITIYYVTKIWGNWNNEVTRNDLPEESRVRELAREAARTKYPLVIDIEHWPLRGDDNVIGESIRKYLKVLEWVRVEAPYVELGFYGVLPARDYWRAVKKQTDEEYKEWQSENERLKSLADKVDIVYPSLYTFYNDRSGWEKYALAQIRESRRYGKKVYVFLWPQFHDSNKILGGKFLHPDFWKLQLETALQHADGIVIWGGWGVGKSAEWDDNAPWWVVTKDFMKRLHNQP